MGAASSTSAHERNQREAAKLCGGINGSQPLTIDDILEEVQRHSQDIQAYWTRDTIAAVLPRFDADSDGKLTFDEFLAALNSLEGNVEACHGPLSPKLRKLVKRKSRPATAKRGTGRLQLGFSLGPPARVVPRPTTGRARDTSKQPKGMTASGSSSSLASASSAATSSSAATATSEPTRLPSKQLGFAAKAGGAGGASVGATKSTREPPRSPFRHLIPRSPLRWPPQREWVWKKLPAPHPDGVTLALPSLPSLSSTPRDSGAGVEGPRDGQTALSALEELEALEVPIEKRKEQYWGR